MSNYNDVGCVGGSCPKQESCARFIEKDDRPITYRTPPFNSYPEGIVCGYYQVQKKKED